MSLHPSRMTANRLIRERFTRHMPTSYCAGCGHGIVLNAFTHALDYMNLRPTDVVAVSGIGCSGWVSSPHLRADTIHTTHGRAIPVAIGVKVFNPKLNVFVFTGDGDGSGIGGNHLIHAARRNIDIMVILLNNNIYGMTGGQVSPATPQWAKTATTWENPEHPFDLAKLVEGAGATYVARWTTAHPRQLANSIAEAYLKRGFSFIEVLSQCPTQYGRRNRPANPFEMLQELKTTTTRNPEKEPEKIPLGVFVRKDPKNPSFLQAMTEIKERYIQQRDEAEEPLKIKTKKSVLRRENYENRD